MPLRQSVEERGLSDAWFTFSTPQASKQFRSEIDGYRVAFPGLAEGIQTSCRLVGLVEWGVVPSMMSCADCLTASFVGKFLPVGYFLTFKSRFPDSAAMCRLRCFASGFLKKGSIMKCVDQDSFAIESNCKIASFDFDAWQQLAQSDPDEFEQKRRMLLDGLVEKMQCRDDSLMQMRLRIDQQRSKQSFQDALPRLMHDLAKSFKQLNADFASRTKRGPN